jgi:hypothetical protein
MGVASLSTGSSSLQAGELRVAPFTALVVSPLGGAAAQVRLPSGLAGRY